MSVYICVASSRNRYTSQHVLCSPLPLSSLSPLSPRPLPSSLWQIRRWSRHRQGCHFVAPQDQKGSNTLATR